MLIKHFNSREEFYKFLQKQIGISVKEAEERASDGVFHCIYIECSGDMEPIFLSARNSCVSVFENNGKFMLCGSESSIKQMCSELVKYESTKALARNILESLIKYRKSNFKLQYNGKILPLGLKTAVMGVLNVTPDSFSDGGLYFKPDAATKRAAEMVGEGAEIVDIGGESTRPGSKRISTEEELKRVLPVLRQIRKELPNTWISIDTYKAEVARICLEEGADIINDISGGSFDDNMLNIISEYGCPYVINHIKGKPETWVTLPIVYDDPVAEITQWFQEKIEILKGLGYRYESNAILDPGIGFGKKPEHNVEIIKRLREFKVLGLPILLGVSRKSFVGIILREFLNMETAPVERLYGSLGAAAYAVIEGASILRVHDVKETRQFLAVLDAVRTFYGY